jgi:hypothetical protein
MGKPMASGIYRLTFSSGKYYIGKSLDLETRWKQHFNKFATGKAARPMQVEYDRCGLPKTEVLIYCHKDHIDIMEELLIDQEKSLDMLNTTYPEVERTDEVVILINKSKELLHLSTLQHLEIIHGAQAEIDAADKKQAAAEALVEEYREAGYIIDSDYTEAVDNAQHWHDEYKEAQAELKRLSKLNWFDRLFSYKVYV